MQIHINGFGSVPYLARFGRFRNNPLYENNPAKSLLEIEDLGQSNILPAELGHTLELLFRRGLQPSSDARNKSAWRPPHWARGSPTYSVYIEIEIEISSTSRWFR